VSRYLADTHALLWWFTDDERLSARAREVVGDRSNEVYASAASAWEIATKARLGKLASVPSAAPRYGELVAANGFSHLSVSHRHGLVAGAWEVAHRDPFDRMLAAQSHLEQLPLITTDQAFDGFGIDVIW
jgi:PIN domain nuclease of toxin-antitoxin system